MMQFRVTTREGDVLRLFDFAAEQTGGPPAVVVYNAGNNAFVDFRKTEAAFFEDMWRVACFGGGSGRMCGSRSSTERNRSARNSR